MSLVIPFSAKEISYGDITGSFPFKSSRGNQYIYLLYDYDSNAIFVEPMKTRKAQEITTTWKNCMNASPEMGIFADILFLIMNVQRIWNEVLKNTISPTNLYLPTSIDKMRQNGQYVRSKVIFFQAWPPVILTFQSQSEICCYPKPN